MDRMEIRRGLRVRDESSNGDPKICGSGGELALKTPEAE